MCVCVWSILKFPVNNKRKPPPSSASCARHKSPSTNFLWHRIHSFRAPSSSSTSCREDPHLPHPSQPPKYTTSSGCLYQACQLYLSFVPFTQFIIRMCTPARRALRNAFEHRIEGGVGGGLCQCVFPLCDAVCRGIRYTSVAGSRLQPAIFFVWLLFAGYRRHRGVGKALPKK